MYVIVGLGNPGKDYKWTRHNIGFEVIDKFAYDYNINMNKKKFKSIIGEGIAFNKKVTLVQPQTYMNLSGESVRDLFNFYKFNIQDLIVVYDDINLPVGNIRIRPKGSDGGHNGMKSIIYQLESDNFVRIRVGIGNKPEQWNLKDFVLSRFKKEEEADIIKGITYATDSIELILKDKENGINDAMNKFNKKVSSKQDN